MAARSSDDHFIRCFRNRDFRGNEPFAVRPTRGRTGTGWRLSHGIFLDEVRAFFSRRICSHDYRIGRHRDFIFRWMASATSVMAWWVSLGTCRWKCTGLARRSRRLVQYRHLFREGGGAPVFLYLGAFYSAALPLRSTYAARLVVLFRDRAREYLHRRNHSRLRSVLRINHENRKSGKGTCTQGNKNCV